MVQQAIDIAKMYTHLRKLDKTRLGSFELEGSEKFFPEADRIIDDWHQTMG